MGRFIPSIATMTSGDNEIRARLSAVEHEATAARQLAAAAYEEVGSLAAGVRANTSLLNALRETQVEHGLRLNSLESEVRTGFAVTGQGIATIVSLLDRLSPES